MGDAEASRPRSPEPSDQRRRPSRSQSPIREPERNREGGRGSHRGGHRDRDGYRDREREDRGRYDRDDRRERGRDDWRDRGRGGDRPDRPARSDRLDYDAPPSRNEAAEKDTEYGQGWAADRPKPKKRSGGGFKVKEKRRDDEEGDERSGHWDDKRRDRSPRRDRDGGRDRDQDRDHDRRDGVNDRRDTNKGKEKIKEKEKEKDKDKAKPPKSRRPPPPPQEFMIVNVNDRLGTKAAIPCMGSDLIRQFKMMVAARIGRDASEIMLRRQGERPFKDHLTLDDYGVVNGVQLDLELDTGD